MYVIFVLKKSNTKKYIHTEVFKVDRNHILFPNPIQLQKNPKRKKKKKRIQLPSIVQDTSNGTFSYIT